MELDAFIGKWQEESKQGFDEFAKALGLPPEKTEFYRHAKTVISYNRDNDGWIINVGVANVPDVPSVEFRFRMGEPYNSANLDGTPMESFITAENGMFLEKHKMAEMKNEMHITRQIQSDSGKMVVTTTYNGEKMTSIYSQV